MTPKAAMGLKGLKCSFQLGQILNSIPGLSHVFLTMA